MPRKERNRKDERKKRIEAQRAKQRTPTPALDALIGDEEQTGKKKREQRKKQGVGLQTSYPRPFGLLLGPTGIMRRVYSCDPHLGPQGGI